MVVHICDAIVRISRVNTDTLMENTNRRLVDVSVALLVLIFFAIGVIVDMVHNPMQRSYHYRKTRTLNWVVLGFSKAVQTSMIMVRVTNLVARYTLFALATVQGSTFLHLSAQQCVFKIVTTIDMHGWLVLEFGPCH